MHGHHSTDWRLGSFVPARRALSDVAQVQIALLVGERVPQLQSAAHLAGAGDDAAGLASEHQGSDGHAELVEQIGFGEQPKDPGATLVEHPHKSAFGQEVERG